MTTRTLCLSLLCLVALGAQPCLGVKVAWDPNPAGDGVIGYRLHRGTASGRYEESFNCGNTLVWTWPWAEFPEKGIVYYSVVTAYNAAGLESMPSNEISFYIGYVEEDDGWGMITRWWNPRTEQTEYHMCRTANMFAEEGIDTTLFDRQEDGTYTHIPLIFIDYSEDLINWTTIAQGEWSASISMPAARRGFLRSRIEVIEVIEVGVGED